MIRKIIKIDKEKCNGCGACVTACHEGAIALVDGKAELIRDDYCDGLGDCLPACPTDAISFEEREALPYDEKAVLAKKANSTCGCYGGKTRVLKRENTFNTSKFTINSQLNQWPIQMQLVSINASYFENCNLLVAADCTAYAYGNFHNDFIKDHIILIWCPKLDSNDYTEKLSHIIKHNNIRSITIARMDVPCCSGIVRTTREAIAISGKNISLDIKIITSHGKVL